ncbi:MAG: DUF6807 family protein [Pirellulales bacterium]
MSIARVAVFVALALAGGATATRAQPPLRFETGDSGIQISALNRPVASYVWRDAEILRPYFAHLHTPGGVQVSRRHPPVEGQDATDHAAMHPGVWLGFGDLSGADFWRNKGAVKHVNLLEPPLIDADGGQFAVKNAYTKGDRTVCEEVCRVRFDVGPAGYWITMDSTFSGSEEFYFGDQEEMGLGIRVATPITVKNGGRIVNSDGLVNESQVWGKPADWCDYSGTIDGRKVGLLIAPHPDNFRRSWFHARDYGVLVANPFGQQAFTKGEKSKVVVRPGESLRLRFGVLLHEGDVDLSALYQDWLRAVRNAN